MEDKTTYASTTSSLSKGDKDFSVSKFNTSDGIIICSKNFTKSKMRRLHSGQMIFIKELRILIIIIKKSFMWIQRRFMHSTTKSFRRKWRNGSRTSQIPWKSMIDSQIWCFEMMMLKDLIENILSTRVWEGHFQKTTIFQKQ